jgi:hypothetical protein
MVIDRSSSRNRDRREPSVVVGGGVHDAPTARGEDTVAELIDRERQIASSLAGGSTSDGLPGISLLFPADNSFDDDEDDVDTVVMSTRSGTGVSRMWRGPARTGVTLEQFRSKTKSGPAAHLPPERLDDDRVEVFDLVRIGADTWVRSRRSRG